MISCGRRGDIGNRVASLAHINGSSQRQRCRIPRSQCADGKQAGARVVASLSNGTGNKRQPGRKRIGQRNVGGLSRSVVGDFDFKDNGVAFRWGIVTAAQCLDCHQIGLGVDINRLFKLITYRAWIRLIADRCSRDIGDAIASLAHINGSFKQQRCRVSHRECANGEQAGGRVVRSLSEGTGNKRDACRQRVGQRNIGGLGGALIGDFDFEDHRVAFSRSAVAAGQ